MMNLNSKKQKQIEFYKELYLQIITLQVQLGKMQDLFREYSKLLPEEVKTEQFLTYFWSTKPPEEFNLRRFKKFLKEFDKEK